jgi:transcriptional regulator with XRE-family HTH domain
MSLGNTLRAAREACGITTSELAARTHMLVQIVEGLEKEDFRRIPAPIYGRGFIKLYCEAVNLDPKPLQAEFMQIFNRPKDAPAPAEPPPVRQMAPAPAPEMPPAAADEVPEIQKPIADSSPDAPADASVPELTQESTSVSAEPPPMAEFGELFAQPAAPAPIQRPDAARPTSANLNSVPPKRSYGDLFETTYAAEKPEKKTSATEKFRNTMSNVSSGVFANVQKLPTNFGRLVAVSICALLTLALLGWGVAELYKATTPSTGEGTSTRAGTAESTKVNAPAPASAARKSSPSPKAKSATSAKPGELKASKIEIPALYID